METLAYVGGSRWRIETEFETEKSDVGLDEYETRTWAGWHHHVALCLLGGAFLLSLQQAWGKKMPRITRPQSLPSCRRGSTGWCGKCCPGNGSGLKSCCGGWRIRRTVTNGPGAPMKSAAPPFAPPQTGPGQHAELDLRHVEPRSHAWVCSGTPAYGRCAGPPEPERSRTATPSGGCSGCPKPGGPPGHPGRLRPPANNPMGEVLHGAPLGDRHMAPATARLVGQKQIAGAGPHVFVVLAPRTSGLCRQWHPGFGQELGGCLVEAEHRPGRVIELSVEVQYILHGRHELPAYLGDAPLLLPPRLEAGVVIRRNTSHVNTRLL